MSQLLKVNPILFIWKRKVLYSHYLNLERSVDIKYPSHSTGNRLVVISMDIDGIFFMGHKNSYNCLFSMSYSLPSYSGAIIHQLY